MKKPTVFAKTINQVLFLLILFMFVSGCGAQGSPAKQRSGSAAKLLSESLGVMKNTKSYSYKGSGTIQYIGINDKGAFSLAGDYQSPRNSHMTMELKLGSANYHSEILYRNQKFYQLVNDSWKMIPFSSDTLMQPGYKPANVILDQAAQLYINPVFGPDEEISGKKLAVVKVNASPKKLKLYLQKQFDRAANLEPERRRGLLNFLRTCTVTQVYTLYIDPETKQIVKILFRQNVKINLSNHITETNLSIDYTLSDFGAKFTMPSITGKH